MFCNLSIFNFFGKKPTEHKIAFTLRAELHPYRLVANTSDFVDLEISIANNSSEQILSSLMIKVPKGLGFEQSAISQEKQMHLGVLVAKEVKKLKLRLYGTTRTAKGVYSIHLHVFSHYKDYDHVLNEIRKTMDLRVD